MTPLAGLMMGSRCGDIDPAIPIFLQQEGLSLEEVDTLLNKNSGLIGIAKDNDMRRLCARAEQGDALARLAIQMYVYRIQKTIGAYFSQTPHLDALIFTGGIGENASHIREKIMQPLQHLDFHVDKAKNTTSLQPTDNIGNTGIPLLVIRGDEEWFIANAILQLGNQHANL
jgi:acetate kinase